MKYEIWTKAMEEISDRHIVEAAKIQKKRRRPLWLGLTAAAAVAAIVLGVVLWPGGSPLVPTGRRSARRNIRHLHPIRTSRPMPLGPPMRLGIRTRRRREWSKQCNQTLGSFLSSTIPQFLAGQTEENRVYSPLSLYMALAMLAELTDGNSRQQVLDLLDVPGPGDPANPGHGPVAVPLCERWGHHLHSGFFVMAESRRNLRQKHLGHPVQNLLCLHLSGKNGIKGRPTRPCGVGSTSRPVGFFRSRRRDWS